jgi:tRNA pseudouridine(38-40) synthase
MVPSYMLCSREEVRNAFNSAERGMANEGVNRLTPIEASNIVSETITPEILQHVRSKLVCYRANTNQMNRIKDSLKVFEGTHSFHNYTRRIAANDASATRYIMSFVPLNPIIVPGEKNDDGSKADDTEWIPIQVTGQSFLLNQIRKMISAAVDLARGAVTREQINESLTKKCRMKVNVAPAQGLFLDRSFFEMYNKQKAQSSDHRPLNWVEGEETPAAGEDFFADIVSRALEVLIRTFSL